MNHIKLIASKLPNAHHLSNNRLPSDMQIHFSIVLKRKIENNNKASSNDIEKIVHLVQEAGISVSLTEGHKRRIKLIGEVSAIESFFKIEMKYFDGSDKFYGFDNELSLPEIISDHVVAILGLDNHPRELKKLRGNLKSGIAAPDDTEGETTYPTVTSKQMADLYGFPTDVDGTGQSVTIVQLGGGFLASDMDTYFSNLGLSTPDIISKVSASGSDTYDPTDSANTEVALDIQVLGAVAPKAKIVVYFGGANASEFIETVSDAVHDADDVPSVISISWGMSEKHWNTSEIAAFQDVLNDAVDKKITVLASTGDLGYQDQYGYNGPANLNYPASDPTVLSCGGTMLQIENNTIKDEQVWFQQAFASTGGGVSDLFGVPTWQKSANVPLSINTSKNAGRGTPDVAGNAVNYSIVLNGETKLESGTSAVVPLWAAYLILVNQSLGQPVGFINALLYKWSIDESKDLFNPITKGSNGGYDAGVPWNACTGLGSPKASQILEEFKTYYSVAEEAV